MFFIYSFLSFSLFFFFIFFFFSSGLKKSDLFLASIASRFLVTFLFKKKNIFLEPSRRVPLWVGTLFLFFSSIFCFFLFFSFFETH